MTNKIEQIKTKVANKMGEIKSAGKRAIPAVPGRTPAVPSPMSLRGGGGGRTMARVNGDSQGNRA